MAAALSSSRSALIASSSSSSSSSSTSATPLCSSIIGRSTRPSLLAVPAGSPSSASSRRSEAAAAARIVARATPTREKADATPPSGFPLPTESSADDRGSLLPRRNPGSFPSPALASALQRLSIELLEGADTGAVSPPGGGEAAFDPLRDGPARYLGYSNECGEAFAAWLPPFGVPLSYAVAIGYVVVDTIDKGLKAYSAAGAELERGAPRPDVDVERLRLLLSLERATDTIVWQLLASVFVPGFTIHTVVQAAHAALLPLEAARPVRDAAAALAGSVGAASADALLLVADKSIPTVVGLAAIPFIVHPIDNAIHALLNVTLRPALKRFVCEQGKGKEAGLELCEECGPWKRPGNKGGGSSKH